MQTFPIRAGDLVTGFEMPRSACPPRLVARVLSLVAGVESIRVRRLLSKWEHIHVWFTYQGVPCAVIEPFGDSSRYLFEQVGGETRVDFAEIEKAFQAYSLRDDVKKWWHDWRSRRSRVK